MKLHENEKCSTCIINDCFHMAFGSNCSDSRLQFLFMKTLCLCIWHLIKLVSQEPLFKKSHHPLELSLPYSSFSLTCVLGRFVSPALLCHLKFSLFILLEIISFVLTCTSCWQSCVITYSCLAQCIQDTLSVDPASQLLMHWQPW